MLGNVLWQTFAVFSGLKHTRHDFSQTRMALACKTKSRHGVTMESAHRVAILRGSSFLQGEIAGESFKTRSGALGGRALQIVLTVTHGFPQIAADFIRFSRNAASFAICASKTPKKGRRSCVHPVSPWHVRIREAIQATVLTKGPPPSCASLPANKESVMQILLSASRPQERIPTWSAVLPADNPLQAPQHRCQGTP